MILNIILIILSARLLIDILIKSNPLTTLQCGIWGFHGASGVKFDWTKFDWIGIENDKRGGDACGRVYGNMFEHANKFPNDTYRGYISNMLPPNKKRNVTTIFGHTRKASYAHKGKDGIGYTQPIVFLNDKNNIDYIFSHNGTIYNHMELAEEYGLSKDIDSFKYLNDDGEESKIEFNDSQILGWIIGYKKDYSVLKKYQGTAAFSLYDYRDGKLYLWSGKSKAYEYSNKITSERPLHVLQSKDYLWFSSEYDPLSFINYSETDEIDQIPRNTLLIYEKGKLIESIEIDRSESYQVKIHKKKHQNSHKHDNYKPKDKIKTKECKFCSGTGFSYGNVPCPACGGDGYVEIIQQLKLPMPELFNESIPEETDEMIHYRQGKYYVKGKLAHGEILIDAMGITHSEKVKPEDATYDFEITKLYRFVNGNMMISHKEFNVWSRKSKKRGLSFEDMINMKLDSMYPMMVEERGISPKMKDNRKAGNFNFTGSIFPLFSYNVYEFKDGDFVKKYRPTDAAPNLPDHGIARKTKSDLPFDQDNDKDYACSGIKENDLFEEQQEAFDDTIKRELAEGLAHVVSSVNDMKNTTFIYSDHKLAQKVDELMDSIKVAVDEINIY